MTWKRNKPLLTLTLAQEQYEGNKPTVQERKGNVLTVNFN